MRLFKLCLLLLISLAFMMAVQGCGLYDLPEDMVEPSSTIESTFDGLGETTSRLPGDEIFSINYDSTNTLNPLICNESVNMPLTGLIFEGLFKVNNDFTFDTVICKRWNTIDGLSFTFEIKSGIKCHDGSDLTMNDIIYSINLARTSTLYAGRLKSISNVYEENGMLCITILKPNMKFPALLDFPIMKDGTGGNAMPVGTGPYTYIETSDYKYLAAFDGYRDRDKLPVQRFYLKEYVAEDMVSAFENSYIDLIVTNKSEMGYVEFTEDYEKRFANTTEMHYLGFNGYSGFCASATRRLIISSVIDRGNLTATIMKDTLPAVLPVSPASEYYLQNVAQTALIDKNNITDYMISAFVEDFDRDGYLEYIKDTVVTDVTLDFIVNKDNLKKVTAAQYIADSLREYGFVVNLRELNWDEYVYSLENGIYDLYYGEVKLSSDFDLTELLCTGGSANYWIYDVQLESLIYEYNNSLDRKQAAEELYTYIADNVHIAPLLFEKKLVFTHRGVISNMSPTQNNIFSNIAEWTIENQA